MIVYRTGDLFDQPDVRALAHGVNCRGVMGAGIAVPFRQRFPAMHDQYQKMCAYRALRPGDVLPWYTDHNVIFNLATQDLPGSDARLDALGRSLHHAMRLCASLSLDKLGVPRIGAGIGGLLWEDVQAVYETACTLSPEVDLIVVSLPDA